MALQHARLMGRHIRSRSSSGAEAGRPKLWSCGKHGRRRLLRARILKRELELPPFEGHHHPPELTPTHISSINDEGWQRRVCIEIAIDPSANLRPVDGGARLFINQIARRKGAPYSLDEAAHQVEEIGLCRVNNLELIASANTFGDFKGIERNPVAEMAQQEMECSLASREIGYGDRLEADMLEADPQSSAISAL